MYDLLTEQKPQPAITLISQTDLSKKPDANLPELF
jgi:hypothetical protein